MTVPTTVDLTKYIETRLFGDRPHIRGRRIPVATIAYNAHTNHWSVAELGHNFGLSESEVLAALLFYTENKTEIDFQEKAYQTLLDEDYRRYGNPD